MEDLKQNWKVKDALLIYIMYALNLRTGEIILLMFEDINNTCLLIIKLYWSQKEKLSKSIYLKHFTMK